MKNMLRRNLALLLAVVMILSCAPLDGMAAVIGASQLFDQFADQLTTDYSGGASIARIVQPPAAVDTYVFKVDEETIATQKVKKGDVLYEPAAPSKDGYKFTGWQDAAGSAPVFGLVEAEATGETYTYTAQFAQVYYVFFMDDQGRVQITREGTAGNEISTQVTIKLQNAQAAVTGWYYDAALTQPVQDGHVTLSGANITLWPKVEEGYYLTFETNGGTYYPPAFYMPGKPTVDPGVPQKAGYSFTGWKDETGASFAFGSALTADKTLTAQWQANQNTQYTVIHWMENANDDGYSFKESEEKTGTTGAQTAAAARNYTGFTAQTITQTAIAADGSTIVSVYYKRNVYDVKFYSTRGKEYTDLRITAKYGASIGDKWPTYDGSSTWATKSDGSGPYQVNIDTMPLNGANFYGPKTGSSSETAYYYVEVLPGETGTDVGGKSYKLHHSDTSPGTGYTVTVEDQYPITGYTFNASVSTKTGGRYNNAKFYYTRNSYAIIYMNGGSEVTAYRTSVLFEQTIPGAANKPAPTPPMGKENYTFEGWYDDPAGQMLHAFSGKMPAQNITVYAKWAPPTVSGTAYITMAGNGSAPITIAYGGTINPDDLPTPTAPEGDGWEFVAWATKAGDVYTPFNFDTKIYENIELYPYYVNKNQYQVTYHPGQGTGTVEDTRRYASGAEADVKAAAGLTPPAGKVFVGWKVESTGETKQPGDKLTITGNMTLTAQWGDAPAAVTLTYYGNGGKTADGQTSTSVTHENNATISTLGNTAFTRRGYTLTGWNTQANGQGDPFNCDVPVLIDSHGDNALYAVWALDAEQTVTVTYASEDAQKGTVSHTEDTIQIVSGDPVKGSTATANPGYTFVGWYKGEARISSEAALTAATAKASLNKDADGLYADTTYIARFAKRTDLSYTVHYYWNGTATPVAESKTVDGQTYGASITESPKPVDGCTPVSTASQTIILGTGENVIIFYYYKNVELTAASKTVAYNGNKHTVSGFNGAPEEANFDVIKVGAEGTNADTYPAVFPEGTVGTVDANGKYIVTKATDGALTITPKTVIVNVTGRHTTHVYDGKAHTAEGFDTDAPAGVTVALAAGKAAYAQRTDAGTTNMGLNQDSFVVTSDNYDVTIGTVTDGYVTITPVTDQVTVTITENSDTVTYDGQPHNVHGYQEMKANNALYNVAASVKETPTAAWTATGTDAGEYPVGIKAEDFKNINPNFTNVKFEIKDGSLKITPVTAKVTVTVTENSGNATYDGTEHTLTGYSSITADNELYDVKTSVQETATAAWTAKGTNAGKYPIGIKAGDFENINKNFANVEFVIVDGALTIDPIATQVTVTVKENSASVVYDGKEHNVEGYERMTADNALYNVETDVDATVTLAWKAKGTEVGKYDVGIQPGDFANTNPNFTNVKFVIEDGALEITPADGQIVVRITGKTGSFTYDGTEKTVTGYDIAITDPNGLYTAANFAFTGSDTAKGTDVGAYAMGLKAEQFQNTNTNFDNEKVTFEVVRDGQLTISQRPVTFTGETATKVYNGEAQSITAIAQSGLVEGHTLAVMTYAATGTDVGEYPGAFSGEAKIMNGTEDVTANYAITKKEGKLTITAVTDKVIVTVTEKSGTVTYDGAEHTVTGYESISADNTLYNVKASVKETPTDAWTAKGTDAGEYPVGVKAEDFENTNKNFDNVEFKIVDGLLKIDPVKAEVTVTIVGNHATVLYNAREHTVQGYTATSSNPLFNVDTDFTYGKGGPSGEEAKALRTASGTNVAQYMMGLQSSDFVTVNQNFEHVTYAVTDGYLEIEKRPVVVEVDNSGKVYGNADPAFANATLRFYEGQQIITPNKEMQAELAGIDLTVHRADAGNDTVGNHENVLVISKTAEKLHVQYPNYLIGVNPGDFEITATAESLIVRADNYENAYDGNAHGVVAKAYVNNTRTLTEAEDAQIKYWNETTGAYDLDESPAYTDVKSATPGDRVYTVRFQATLDGLTAEGSANVLIAPQELVFTSNSASRDYTGQPLTRPDVTLSSGHIINGEIYDYKATGTVTNAYDGVATNTIVYSTTAAFKPVNYEIELKEGQLDINPRDVVLTSQTKSKEYDGTPLTMPHVTIGRNGFVEGEVTDIRATGSVTYVTDGPNHDGVVTNTIEYTPAGNFDARNYRIVKNEGELSITRRTGTMVIETLSDSKVYDGSALYYPYQTLHGSLAKGDQLVVSNYVSDLVNVGNKQNTFESFRVENKAGQDTTANYTFGETIYGTLEITARPLTITVAGNTVTYDGQSHGKADPAYTVNQAAADAAGKDNGVGLVNPAVGDKTQTHTLTGTDIAFTAVNAGTYENQLNMVKDNVKILSGDQDVTGNYAITILPGTLTINQRPVTITANSLEYDYNYESPVAHPAQDVARYSLNEGLLDGDTVTAEVRYDGQDQQTLIGAYDAVVQEGVVIKSGEADVTANYAITLVPGLLKIKGDDPLDPKKETVNKPETNFNVGDTIRYAITVKNVSQNTAENIAVTDRLATIVPGEGYTVANNTATIASIPAGGQVIVNAEHTVTAADVEAAYADNGDGTRTNVAQIFFNGTVREVTGESEPLNNQYTYVVHYYWNNSNKTKLQESRKGVTAIRSEIFAAPPAIEGYTPVSRDSKHIIVRADESQNVIEFYYYKNVELTANSATYTYDSTEKQVNGFVVWGEALDQHNALIRASFPGVTVGAKGVYAGTYPANFAQNVVNTVDNTGRYIVVKTTDGQLVIEPIKEKTITITAASDEKTYDGTALTSGEYTYTQGVLVNGDKLVVTVEGSQTDAGSSANRVTGYKVMYGEKDVTANYTFAQSVDGTLTVKPVAIELTANSAEKLYDGTPLTDGGYRITKGRFVGEEGLESVTVEGSQTLVGTSANVIKAHVLKDNTKTQNYIITYQPGTLEVRNRNAKYHLTVEANSGSKVYDGTALKVEGFKQLTFTVNGEKFTVSGLTAEKTATNVSESGAVAVTGTAIVKDAAGNDVSAQFNVQAIPGTLTITKRPVTITAENNTVKYDGKAHGANPATPYTVKAATEDSGLAGGHKESNVNIAFTATNVGTYVGALEIAKNDVVILADGANVTANYKISVLPGTLEITGDKIAPNKTTPQQVESNYKLGDTIPFTITVKNVSTAIVENIIVEDPNAILVAGQGYSVSEDGHTATIPSLAPDAQVEIQAQHVVTEADILAGTVGNTATVAWENTTRTVEAGTEEIEEPNGALGVTKETTSTPKNGKTYALGETITYKITVTNTGNLTAKNIQVTDSLSAKEGQVIATIDSLAPGASQEIPFAYVVTEQDILNGKVVNEAAAKGETDDPGEKPEGGDEKEDETDDVDATLEVVKTSNKQEGQLAGLGETIEYTITVTNKGNVTYRNVKVDDELTGLHETIDELGVGASESFTTTYTVTEEDILKGHVRNEATAAADPIHNPKTGEDEIPKGSDEVTDETVAAEGALGVTKETTSTPKNGKTYALGETITYKITVTNTGNLTAKNIQVTDSLSAKEGQVIATIDSLAPGASQEIPFAYVVTEQDILNGKVVNEAAAKGETDDPGEKPEGGDEKEDETDDVDATLEVVKTSNKQEGQLAGLGETIEYTITVTNKGNVTFRNVKVDDELTGLHETIDELGVGASESFTTTYTVTEEDILKGHVRNVATAEGDKVPDPKNPDDPKKPAGEDEQDDPTDEPDASLTVVKSLTNRPNKGYFTLGETAEFDVVVTNTGNVTLKNIRLTEMLEGAEFVTGEGYTVKNGQAVIEELKPGQEDGDGQSVTVKATYTIQTKDLGMSVLKNIVAGEGEGPGKNPDDEGGTEFDVDYAKQVNAVKVWEDEENKHETRPAAITFVLMDESTGEELDRKDATAANEWSVSFDNLPAHDADGNEIIYVLKEIEVTGYDTRYGGPVEPTVAPPVIQGAPETDKGGEQIPGDAEQDEPVERDVHKIDQTIINTLRSHKLTIRYWVEVVGGQKAFDTYEKEYYYNEQYSVVSPGMYGYEPDLPRVQGRMPDEDLEIDVVYVRQIYKLTIYYIFEDGTTAHKEYEAKLYADEKFEVESPEINGYKPNLWMISGVMPDRNLNYTVIYIARTKPVEIQEAVAPLGVGSVVPNTGDCFD